MTLLAAALDLAAAGLSVVPVRPDGTKAPAAMWKTYQHHAPGPDELNAWFGPGSAYDGLGVVCGAVSGQLEMLELEGRAVAEGVLDQLRTAYADHGLADLWDRIDHGYLEVTPSGGLHWHYRVDGEAQRNLKLARRPATPDELAANPAERHKVLIETRGAGGFTVTAPSAGRSHPTGRAWTVLRGSPANIPTITVDERDQLHHVATLLDQMPVIDHPTHASQPNTGQPAGDRPGDDFNTRADWADILDGWHRTKSFGGGAWGWTRPGKQPGDGISATTGRNDGDNLFVFSSATEFETETPISKFAAYTLLHHGGDYAAAAKTLRGQGYGKPLPEPERLTFQPELAPQAANEHQVVGNLATVTQMPPPRPIEVVAERTLVYSDDANALALVDRFGPQLRHCADRGRWYAWDGTVWAPCPRTSGPAREMAKRVARALPQGDEKATSWKKKSLSAIGVSAMLTQAATDDRVAVDFDELDAHPWELNTPGGIVDLRTGDLLASDPAKLHTRLTTCTPDADADRSVWLRFLDTTFGGDQALITYMQRLVGYSAIGIVGPHVLPYCYGSGGNGKGAFLETCVKVLGEYATSAPSGFLMAKNYQGHETEVARLSGARMVLCSEVNDDDRFDEARVKLLTGGDTLTARFMAQDHFTFTPTHQLWAMGNHQPHVRAGGPSFWRRLRLIPFLHSVPEDQIVDDLQGILASVHGPAVLAWIVEGAVGYHRGGLPTPSSVLAATDGYARDQDTVTRFLEEMCHVGGAPLVQTKTAVIRSAYESWCHETGDQPVTAKAFTMALERHGIDTTRTRTARFYTGVALIGEPSEPDRPEPIRLTIEPSETLL